LGAPRKVVAVGIAAAIAAIAAGCGDNGGSSSSTTAEVTGIQTVKSSTCSPAEYGGTGQPDALIVSDEPMQGDSAERSNQMVDAIRLELNDSGWMAGDTAVAFQVCDDSIPKTGAWDPKVCKSNAAAYAADPDLVGVVGTYNSGCAALIMPILNEAPGGGVAMVSPGNTLVCLTQTSDACKADEPDVYFPSGSRNYARVVPNDAAQGAGLATFAQDEGIKHPFVLWAGGDPVSKGQGINFKQAADDLGLDVTGFESWDPEAKDYADLMGDAKKAGADAVLLAGLLEQNGAQIIQDKVKVLGPNDGDVRLLAPDGFAQQATIDDAGDAATGMFTSVPGRNPDHLPPTGQTFVSDLKGEIGDAPVELYAPYAGAAAETMMSAIEQGGTNRAQVVDALLHARLKDSVVGSFRIGPTGDPSENPITVSEAQATFEPVKEITPPASLIAAARG
jgi:branched-chain amino acid transport system substrate-binding protein